MRSIFLDWLRDRWGELIARNASTGEISLRTDPTTEDILVRKNPQIVTDAVSTGAGTTAETYFTVPDGRLWLVRFAGTSISTPENHYLDGRIYDGPRYVPLTNTYETYGLNEASLEMYGKSIVLKPGMKLYLYASSVTAGRQDGG